MARVGDKSSAGDDFTVIPGVGAAIDRRLHKCGLARYRDLVAAGVEQLAALLAGVPFVTAERIRAQNWVGWATQLAAVTPITDAAREFPPQAEHDSPRSGYESFVVRLSLDDTHRVRTVRVQHVATGEVQHVRAVDDIAAVITRWIRPTDGDRLETGGAGTGGAEQVADQQHFPYAPPALDWITIGMPPGSVAAEAPFTIDVTLDLSATDAPLSGMGYSAAVYMAEGGGSPRRIAASTGPLHSDTPTVTLASNGVPAGDYHLDVVVELREPAAQALSAVSAFTAYAETRLTVLRVPE